MKIFDNIGCEFSYNAQTQNFILLGPLPGYSSLVLDDAGVSIPYLARNINGKNIEYELGVGYLTQISNQLVVTNKKVLSSSNNGSAIDFNKPGNKQFYIFVNSVNFNSAFNNLFVENKDFDIEPRKSTYIVDVSSGYVIGNLPDPAICEAVELEFRSIGDDGSLNLRGFGSSITISAKSYTKLVSTGSKWIQLVETNDESSRVGILSTSTENTFGILSDPSGYDRALQYNDNGVFAASSLYQGDSGKLLFGSDSEANAKHIVPSSGNSNLIINATKDGSNFIVYGTGNAPGYPEKNLYFSYDGRLGINMPSGVNTGGIIKPLTVLHVFNTLCREGIRLENRADCYPANITLYDNPISYPRPSGSGIAKIVFAGKDASANKIDFASVEAKMKSPTAKLGQLDISVYNGNAAKTTISSSSDRTRIETNNSSLDLNGSAVQISGGSINATASSIALAGSSVSISGATVVVNGGFRLPNISSSNVLLSIDSNKQIVPATGFQIPGINAAGDNILTTTSDGTVVAEWSKYSFWPYEFGAKIGGKDVTWQRYPYRSGEACSNKSTKELQIEPTPLEEFSIGDQIAILNVNNNSTIYRYISNLTITNDNITGFILDQNILITDNFPNLRVYSVSKGGILTNTLYTEGVVSDATDIVLSTRPGVDTVFNTRKKNIDFVVYGSEDIPAFNIKSETFLGNKKPGKYFKYATHIQASDGTDVPPIAVSIDSVGNGPTNATTNNSANINNVQSIWSGKVGEVGTNGRASFYGTFDQNGNVYEWIEDENKIASYQSNQYICGGSWRTSDNDAIRGYIATPRYSGLDDIGFRIASKAGYSNSVVENLLSLSFVRVDDINNPSDTTSLYSEDWYNRFGDGNDQPTPISKTNLGLVSYPYRINSYEITNDQYSIFLNAVATGLSSISGLYKSSMTSNSVGGIIRSGDGSVTPYSYASKNNMANMPVVFVDYVSSIRFINWLSNGAPTGTGIPDGVTEYGSYVIEAGPGGTDQITKNRDQNYWLPSLNEWHKAAYYRPVDIESDTKISAVTIRRENPFEYGAVAPFTSGTGLAASLSIDGLTYTDYLKVGDKAVQDTDRAYHTSIDFSSSIIAATGTSFLVNQDVENNLIGKAVFRPDRTILYQPLLLTTGVVADADNANGFLITHTGINYVANGEVLSGGLFPGPAGGYLLKDPSGSEIISSSGKLSSVAIEGDFYPILSHTEAYTVIHNDVNGVLNNSPWFTVGKPSTSIDAGTTKVISIISDKEEQAENAEELPLLHTDRILVGPPLAGYSGSLLTHNGNKPAFWQPNDFLKAPGATWNRYSRRAVEFISSEGDSSVRFMKFIDLDTSKGGTGPVTLEDLEREFDFNETIAIYNQAREVVYVKVANIGIVDSRDGGIEPSFFVDESTLTVSVCPPIPIAFATESKLTLSENDPDNGRQVGYAFSVQKGAYLTMGLEPEAIDKFACLQEDTATSEYRFKPGTFNTISVRPEIHTTFNTMAEDIDFVVYGYRKTLFTRYEPEWFDRDSTGIPTGLVPAFRIHSKLDNSFAGSIQSGIFKQTLGLNGVATGVLPDLSPKITINASSPYIISSLVQANSGLILPGNTEELNLALEKTYGVVIPSTGLLVGGSAPVSNYADLTVSGVTYTDALITKDVVLGPLWSGEVPVPYELSLTQKIYAPNYPLTINQLGQIVSMIPPPSPEIPSKPVNINAVAKNSAVVLSWEAPEDDGGSEVLGYIVEYSITNGSSWIVYDQINSQTLLPVFSDRNTIRYLDENIINNTGYLFRVRAYNSVGLGPYSDNSLSATPTASLSPDTPQNVRITSGEDVYKIRNSQNITLAWDPVTSIPAGTTLTEYIVEYWIYNTLNNTDIKLATWTTPANSPVAGNITSINITGIDLAPLYYFSVIAKASDNSLSARALYASLGSNTDPRPPGSRPPVSTDNPYNFGTIIFTGSCS